MKNQMNKKIASIILIILILSFSILSIIYLKQLNGNLACNGATILLTKLKTEQDFKINGIIFSIFMITFTITYLIIIKKEKSTNKLENPQFKKAFILIAIVTILASIIIPNNSSDLYYYMATGRLSSKYNVNTFENYFNEEQPKYKDDDVVSSSPAWDLKYAYGPLYWLISRTLSAVPVNVIALLYIYKFVNVIVHLINCYLIFKISKKNKIRNMLIYGLNPLVIFEGIINCHNDLLLVLSILMAFYCKENKKVGLAVLSLALGALIKYIPVLLLPLILKKENKSKIVAYLCEFGLIYLAIAYPIVGSIKGLFLAFQQSTMFANSLYLQLFLLKIPKIEMMTLIGKCLFIVIYFIAIFKSNKPNTYKVLIMLFILLGLTNFRTWYFIWLFSLIPVLDNNENEDIIALSIVGEISNIIVYRLSESYIYGEIYFLVVMISMIIYYFVKKICEKRSFNEIKMDNNIIKS